MSTAGSGSARNRNLAIAAAVVVLAAIVVLVIVLMSRDDDDTAVPPLTTAEQRAGAVRVTYPDRSLPDQPEVVTVDDQRVSLYFVKTSGSGDDVSAVLRVGTDEMGTRKTVVLHKGEAKAVNGYLITLLNAFNTGDLSRDAADVTVTAS